MLNKSYEDAEWIVAELQRGGYTTKNWAIDLNPAVEDGCNIMIPVNGLVGNQILERCYFMGQGCWPAHASVFHNATRITVALKKILKVM